MSTINKPDLSKYIDIPSLSINYKKYVTTPPGKENVIYDKIKNVNSILSKIFDDTKNITNEAMKSQKRTKILQRRQEITNVIILLHNSVDNESQDSHQTLKTIPGNQKQSHNNKGI